MGLKHNWAEEKVRQISPPSKEKSTLIALAHYANPDGTHCHPSIDTIARDTGHSRRTVQRHITELERRGEIRLRRQAHAWTKTNEYYIVVAQQELPEVKQMKLALPPKRQPDTSFNFKNEPINQSINELAEKLRITGT